MEKAESLVTNAKRAAPIMEQVSNDFAFHTFKRIKKLAFALDERSLKIFILLYVVRQTIHGERDSHTDLLFKTK
jgi:hypothetical protein